MIPAGYMAKRIVKKPDIYNAPHVLDIYSVSDCVNKDFTDYIAYWKHNGWWLFDSPALIREVAHAASVDITHEMLFFYEVYKLQFDEGQWRSFLPEASFRTEIQVPLVSRLEGFDVVNFTSGTSPEHSPLSCNGLMQELSTNPHCLFGTLEETLEHLERGAFRKGEPGPYRIFAVYSVDWPVIQSP